MIYYNKSDITERTGFNKRKNGKECLVCHYWCFDYEFKFQKSVSNSCHGLSKMSIDINDTANFTIKCVVNCCII